MNTYRVIGVDQVSGADRRELIEAENERAAQDEAYRRGMFIERIELLPKLLWGSS